MRGARGSRRRRHRRGTAVRVPAAVVVAAMALGAAACSNDDDDSAATDRPRLPQVPTEPNVVDPVDDTPFCRTMLELDAATGDDTGDDTGGRPLDDLVGTYVDLAPEVPDEIRPDFDVVLERLVALAAGDDVADPVRAEESAMTLAAYIELRCRGTAMSPLPPPTSPLDDLSPDD